MGDLHQSIAHLPMPARMRALPLTDNGFPVLFFADSLDGKPDLRVMDPAKFVACIERKLCWLCGQPLGRYMAFVLGPMCCVTRTTSEPPCHYDCAHYAVIACPFLTRPHMHRRDAGMPEGAAMAGIGLRRNPAASAIWITRSYKTWRPEGGGVLITVGPPERVEWWQEGRTATRAEVEKSVDEGAPALWDIANADKDRAGAIADLAKHFVDFHVLLPAA